VGKWFRDWDDQIKWVPTVILWSSCQLSHFEQLQISTFDSTHEYICSHHSNDTAAPEIAKLERHGYLFGHPIAHSMSPLLHQTVYDNLGLNWSQIPLDSTDMSMFLNLIKHPQFYGAHTFRLIIPKADTN
jgi:hypothetical protein